MVYLVTRRACRGSFSAMMFTPRFGSADYSHLECTPRRAYDRFAFRPSVSLILVMIHGGRAVSDTQPAVAILAREMRQDGKDNCAYYYRLECTVLVLLPPFTLLSDVIHSPSAHKIVGASARAVPERRR